MHRWTAGTAALVWIVGVLVLGTRWEGIEAAPGVWQDSISLRQWAALWLILTVSAYAVGARVRSWPHRMLVVTPLLLWIAWSLRHGALGPLPMVIYGVPTVAAWGAGLLVRDAWRR